MGDDIQVYDGSQKSLAEKFALLFTKEPYKSFRKVGITNGDDVLTSQGANIFLTWMLNKHADEFNTDVVAKLLKEQEDENNNN